MPSVCESRVFTPMKAFARAPTYRAIKRLANQVIQHGMHVDQIIAILDREAPGGIYVGAELFRLISQRAPIRYPLDYVSVIGRQGRQRRAGKTPALGVHAKNILLVDDVAFSGQTLKIAKEALLKRFPDLTIFTATLATGKGAQLLKPDFYVYGIEEREALFPWGSVDSTGEYKTPFGITGLPEAIKYGHRVWGHYEEFVLNGSCTCRVLTVQPQQRLSLQVHFQRDEFFLVLDRNACFQLGTLWRGKHQLTLDELKGLVEVTEQGGMAIGLDNSVELRSTLNHPKSGSYVLVPRGTWHRLHSLKNSVRVMEISFGFYDQDKDIARLEDDYGRKGLPGRF